MKTTPVIGVITALLLAPLALNAGNSAMPKCTTHAEAGLRVTEMTIPQYPRAFVQKKIEGHVTLEFLVTSQGKVLAPYAVQSTHPEFTRAALKAVESWKFQPAHEEGVPVPKVVRLPLKFSSKESRMTH